MLLLGNPSDEMNARHLCAGCPPLNVMLNPFGFAQAKLREASRFLSIRVLLTKNEILRHYVPQNDIIQELIMLTEAEQSPSLLRTWFNYYVWTSRRSMLRLYKEDV